MALFSKRYRKVVKVTILMKSGKTVTFFAEKVSFIHREGKVTGYNIVSREFQFIDVSSIDYISYDKVRAWY